MTTDNQGDTVTTTQEATRTFTSTAIVAEIGRRKNNRQRVAEAIANGMERKDAEKLKKRGKSWVFRGMTVPQMKQVLDGEIVEVTFKSGRVEYVGLKR